MLRKWIAVALLLFYAAFIYKYKWNWGYIDLGASTFLCVASLVWFGNVLVKRALMIEMIPITRRQAVWILCVHLFAIFCILYSVLNAQYSAKDFTFFDVAMVMVFWWGSIVVDLMDLTTSLALLRGGKEHGG